jgi:hypothetical protein
MGVKREDLPHRPDVGARSASGARKKSRISHIIEKAKLLEARDK